MVIACPCALVISTPVSIVSALTNAARRGILIKGGRHLETLADVRAVAFDKTGTLTEGRPALDEIVMINSYPRPETLRMIAAIEHRSEHHLAAAMVEAAVRDSLEYASVAIEEFEALPGWGVRAVIDGKTYFLGNSLLAHEHGFLTPEIEQVLERLGEEGKTTVIFGRAREPICVLALNDTSRPSGRTAIAALASLGIRHTEMLSGDQERAARHIARETGIGEYRAGLFPEQKVAAVEDLKRRYGTVAMVGDGINDAPALAASSVGIAMGVAGTDVALETADVVLMSDELSKLPHLFGLSHKAIAVIRQNIALAVVVKLVFFGLSLAGVATLWMALLADDGAALAVILNGLRLLSFGENR
jgi:Cd2+/Zn2+-exporting ATPase